MKLTLNLDVSKYSAREGKSDAMRQRNICILYGFLAEKLAGWQSSSTYIYGITFLMYRAVTSARTAWHNNSSSFYFLTNYFQYRAV